MQPTLDVIIPCYNAADTLRAAAESALAQSVVQTVWLVDDASDDDTPGIMRELAAQHAHATGAHCKAGPTLPPFSMPTMHTKFQPFSPPIRR